MTTHKGNFVAYYRVSTDRQGRSGLGLEAQRKAVEDYLNGGRWKLVGEFTDVESGKDDRNRPELARAFAKCRLHGATLLIAKLDRLSRDAHFLLGLQKAGVKFVACDLPQANELTIGILAIVAQHEREMISKRTKEALAAAKARGMKIGGFRGSPATLEGLKRGREASHATRTRRARERAKDLAADVEELRAKGADSLTALAKGLNARSIPTARGGKWSAVQVMRLLETLGE
ncbi:MAG: recombinase family protein [Hyphomicrobiales bacterium]|nr:recombinase family protein [Hyphomicrobiales bacterium]MBV9974608.1 recombinase family protein [Hyphomicrobiales bacterium]